MNSLIKVYSVRRINQVVNRLAVVVHDCHVGNTSCNVNCSYVIF